MRLALAIVMWGWALPVAGQGTYLDDRSSPEAVIASLYNAINMGEFARAWSYYDPDHAPSFSAYVRGFDDTEHVAARTEPATRSDGENEAIWRVPVVLEARQSDGAVLVFSGCMVLAQPAPRQRPPYEPIAIRAGHFHVVDGPAASAEGDCDWD